MLHEEWKDVVHVPFPLGQTTQEQIQLRLEVPDLQAESAEGGVGLVAQVVVQALLLGQRLHHGILWGVEG